MDCCFDDIYKFLNWLTCSNKSSTLIITNRNRLVAFFMSVSTIIMVRSISVLVSLKQVNYNTFSVSFEICSTVHLFTFHVSRFIHSVSSKSGDSSSISVFATPTFFKYRLRILGLDVIGGSPFGAISSADSLLRSFLLALFALEIDIKNRWIIRIFIGTDKKI